MTFRQLQDSVLTLLNLSSDDARERVKAHLNQRYREVQSSVNLAATRRGSVNFVTTPGQAQVTASGIAKLFTLYDPVHDRVLGETTLNQIRIEDPAGDLTGVPERYAIATHVNDTITLHLTPIPDAAYTLTADCLVAGTEMVDDDDEPALPADFHDILVQGALSDEWAKMEKFRPAADRAEAKFTKRLSDLRYFIAKSAHLRRQQVDTNSYTSNIAAVSGAAAPVGSVPMGEWQSYTPSWFSSGTQPTLGDGTLTGQYTLIGDTCHFHITLTFGSTTSFGTGGHRLSLPQAAHPSFANTMHKASVFDADGSPPRNEGIGIIDTGNTSVLMATATGTTSVAFMSSTSPFTWATGDFYEVCGFYRIA